MDKKAIVKFLEQKRRGIYNVIVEQYWEEIFSSTPVNLGLELIAEDLSAAAGKKVELKYVSLAQAVAKARTKVPQDKIIGSKKKYAFKDLHENKDEMQPGKFKID